MTTPSTLIQRAAELVIAFGLEHTGMSASEVRSSSWDSSMMVRWQSPCSQKRKPFVDLFVHRRTDRIEARVSVETHVLGAADAKRVADLYGRVVALAERIEALR